MGHPPPPAPDMDSSSAGQYGTYGSHASHGEWSNRRASRRLTWLQEGYHVDENGNQVQHLPPLSEALHPDDGHYPHPTSAYDAHHAGEASAQGQPPYEHVQSSNFFDPQMMEPPPPADSHHGHMHGTSNGNNYGGQMMTPPPPAASSHGPYSPYQSGGQQQPTMFHRASISGPVMHSHYGASQPSAAAAHQSAAAAPPGGEVWGASSAARPHTADGMFGSQQMAGLPGQWGMAEYNRAPRGSTSSVVSDTPTSGNGKVFSYMPSTTDDGSPTSSGGGHTHSSGPRKRPRRRYDEIERLYHCKWPGCQKSYGTLNHLNAHVAMQKHGAKRTPAEFKEMRKAWRKGKRDEEQRRQANQAAANEEAIVRSKMMYSTPSQPFMTHGSYPVNNFSGSPHVMPPPTSSSAPQVPRYQQGGGGMYGYSHPYAQQAGQGTQGGSGGLGAYLMAHRGSI